MEKVYEVSDLLWGASFQKEVNIVKYSNELSKFLLVEEKILGEVKQKRCWGYESTIGYLSEIFQVDITEHERFKRLIPEIKKYFENDRI